MKYWDDFINKYGFSDGEAEPPDAIAVRSITVLAINVVAQKLGSKGKAVEYNRPGLHNHIMIALEDRDDLLNKAVKLVQEMEESEFLIVNIRMRKDWEERLKKRVEKIPWFKK